MRTFRLFIITSFAEPSNTVLKLCNFHGYFRLLLQYNGAVKLTVLYITLGYTGEIVQCIHVMSSETAPISRLWQVHALLVHRFSRERENLFVSLQACPVPGLPSSFVRMTTFSRAHVKLNERIVFTLQIARGVCASVCVCMWRSVVTTHVELTHIGHT